jgi:ribonucleotide monophosphatase NagD (HAD superfamily)
MIGDNPVADVKGAEAIGIPAILVRSEGIDRCRHSSDLSAVPSILGRSRPPER